MESLEQIISLLKTKDKYDAWVSKGSYFTYRSWKLRLPFDYTFIDLDGKPILGQMQSKEYRSDLDENIPIFGQVIKKDPNFVNQGTYMISTGNLTTSGLATCSALSMSVGVQKFLTHLDANTNIKPMISVILELIKTQGLLPTNIHLYPGSLDSRITKKLAKAIITGIGLDLRSIKIHRNTCMMSNIVI